MAETSYEVRLLTGLAQFLNDNGVGTYKETGYPANFTGTPIVFGDLPHAPSRAIALAKYLDLPGMVASNVTMVQVKTRTSRDVLDAARLTDSIHDLLNRRAHAVLGGLHFDLIWQDSFATLGTDDNSRCIRSQNFAFRGIRGLRL